MISGENVDIIGSTTYVYSTSDLVEIEGPSQTTTVSGVGLLSQRTESI